MNSCAESLMDTRRGRRLWMRAAVAGLERRRAFDVVPLREMKTVKKMRAETLYHLLSDAAIQI